MKKIWIVGAMVVGAFAAATVMVVGHNTLSGTASGASPSGLPWQIETLPTGQSRVMGLTLGPGGSTLAEVQRIWGPNVELAIIAAPGEGGAIEAFIDPAQAGFINGKLVLTLAAPAEAVASMRERALKSEFMESTTRKYTLTPADHHAASALAVSAIAFIPQAKLDAQMVIDRFGPPQERHKVGEMSEHFLYPTKGLDLTLNTKGKDVLQYVAPAEFHKLTAPLKSPK